MHTFFFQRLKYIFANDSKESVQPVKFPVDWDTNTYLDWRGYETNTDQLLAQDGYGLNE